MNSFKAFRIHQNGKQIVARFEDLHLEDLSPGEVVIRVRFSGINYKDALAGTGAGVFDGFDIDWEWPGSPDGHPGNHYSAADKANYTALLAEFRSELDAYGAANGGKHMLLTIIGFFAVVIAVNVTRISLMGVSHRHYEVIHSTWGDMITNSIMLALMVGVTVVGARREIFSRV